MKSLAFLDSPVEGLGTILVAGECAQWRPIKAQALEIGGCHQAWGRQQQHTAIHT